MTSIAPLRQAAPGVRFGQDAAPSRGWIDGVAPARRYRRVALVSVIRAIANVLVRHQRGTNLAGVRVHRQMHLAPGTTLRITVLAYLPFALAKHLQADTVDYQMQRFAATQGRQHDVEIPGAAAQHRVVGRADP